MAQHRGSVREVNECCRQPPHEQWVPLFKVQVFFSCVSFSIIVPSIALYLERIGAAQWVLGVAVAVYSLGEMVGSAVFGRAMTRALREDPAAGPRTALLQTMFFGVAGSALYVAADGLGRSEATRSIAPAVVVAGRFLGGVRTRADVDGGRSRRRRGCHVDILCSWVVPSPSCATAVATSIRLLGISTRHPAAVPRPGSDGGPALDVLLNHSTGASRRNVDGDVPAP